MEVRKIKLIAIEDLLFDPSNPRIPRSRSSEGENSVMEYMIEKENIFDLVASIGEQGFFPGEPLLIAKSRTYTGKFEVVEGNRRLAALKLLNNPEDAPSKRNSIATLVKEARYHPTEVPTLLFQSREEILDYLGYRHITGIDQWDSLQKARFLKQLRDNHVSEELNGTDLYRHLAKLIGSRTDYVAKLLSGFQLYSKIEEKDFFNIPGLNEESFSFSLLTTAVSYSNIKSFLELNDENEQASFREPRLKELTDWMFRRNDENQARVPESRALQTLNAVVRYPEALRKFRDGRSLEEAGLLTDEPIKNFRKLVDQAYKRLQLSQDMIHHIDKFEEQDQSLIEDVTKLARAIFINVKVKREEDF